MNTNAQTTTAKKLNGSAGLHTQTKKTVVDQPSKDRETLGAKVVENYAAAKEQMLSFFGVPGWKRTTIAFVSSFCIGYGIGYVGMVLLDWLLAGAMLAGAGIFIQMVLYAIGVLLMFVAAWKLGTRIGGAILTGEADERAAAAYGAMKSALSKLNPFKKSGKPQRKVRGAKLAAAH